MRTVLVVVVTAVVVAGCSSGSGGVKAVGLRETLTAEEIEKANVVTAYEAVEQLRPNFLQGRFYKPIVYVDNMRYGNLRSLYYILAADIEVIRYISPADATTFWGTGHMGGVLAITTKR